MRERVISDLVPLGDRPDKYCLALGDRLADDEERRFDRVTGERVEDRLRPLGGSIVERERDRVLVQVGPFVNGSGRIHLEPEYHSPGPRLGHQLILSLGEGRELTVAARRRY